MRRRQLAGAIVRLYPFAWRVRYEDEMIALLDARPVTPGIVLDVARGCVCEHLFRPIGHLSPQVLRIVVWLMRIPVAYALAVAIAWSGWFLANYLYGYGWITSPEGLAHLGIGVPAAPGPSLWKSGFRVLFIARPFIGFLAAYSEAKPIMLRRFEFAAWLLVAVAAVTLDCLNPIFRAFNPWNVFRDQHWETFVPPLFTGTAFFMMATRTAVARLVEIREYRPPHRPDEFNVPPSILGLSQ